MSPSSTQEHAWIFDHQPEERYQPHQKHNEHPQHGANGADFGGGNRSFRRRSFQNEYLEKLNHRGYYDPSGEDDEDDDVVTVVVDQEQDVKMGLCGIIPNKNPLPGLFRRLFCREEPSAQVMTQSESMISIMDSFHDNSTLLWTNTTEQQQPTIYTKRGCGDSYSTASSSMSEQEETREMNRRWRRGF